MQEVCYDEETGGLRKICPLASRRGYVIVTAVAGESLEKCAEEFLARNPEKIAELTDRLAELVGTFHRAGFAHRDLYASHLFLQDENGRLQLCLIDLARMFRPRWRKFRWRVKDLAQLKFSMPPQWVRQQWDAFLTRYLGDDDAAARRKLQAAVDAKSAAISRRAARRARRAGSGTK
jgi:hypothetical protein